METMAEEKKKEGRASQCVPLRGLQDKESVLIPAYALMEH